MENWKSAGYKSTAVSVLFTIYSLVLDVGHGRQYCASLHEIKLKELKILEVEEQNHKSHGKKKRIFYAGIPNNKSAGLPVYRDTLPKMIEQRESMAPEHIITKPTKWIPRAQVT